MANIRVPGPPPFSSDAKALASAITDWIQRMRGQLFNQVIPDTGTSGNSVPLLNTLSTFGLGVGIGANTAPATPPAGTFYIYLDTADSKLKAIAASGTVTILATQ